LAKVDVVPNTGQVKWAYSAGPFTMGIIYLARC